MHESSQENLEQYSTASYGGRAWIEPKSDSYYAEWERLYSLCKRAEKAGNWRLYSKHSEALRIHESK